MRVFDIACVCMFVRKREGGKDRDLVCVCVTITLVTITSIFQNFATNMLVQNSKLNH